MKNYWLLCLCTILSACFNAKPKLVENINVGPALGTSYNIIYLADKELDYQTEIDSVFTAVNKSLSTYITDSDISKINKGDSLLVVDHMFKEVFKLSKEIFTSTDGYFDPTVGTLVNAWGFGPGSQIKMDSARVDSLMHYVGFNKVALTDANTIHKKSKNIYFDFNAIAKGYAIDRLAVLMNGKGILNYLIEVGGEVVAKGENKVKERPWGVWVQDPQAEQAKKTIQLKNRAMASSGNYRKFRLDTISGKKYVHTIDPKTGFTKNGSTLATNVLAPTCAIADAYATSFMAMDIQTAITLIQSQPQLDAYLIYLDENGETQEYMTKGFKQVLQ